MSVDSKPFKESPPTIDPPVLEVTFPTRGKDTDMVKFTIKNNCKDRITYKMKGTKTNKFKVVEGFGFVEPKGSTVVELYPIEMATNAGWSKFDYFAVILAPAPKGEHWEPRELWKKGNEMEPKQLKTIKLNLLSLVGKPEEDAAVAEGEGSSASSEESDAE